VLEINDTTDTDRSASYLDIHLEIGSEKRLERNLTIKEMISIFLLWTFHLYVATFQQHLHMEYISLSWYDILELVVPVRTSLIEGLPLTRNYWAKCSSWLSWSHHFECFTVALMTWLSVM